MAAADSFEIVVTGNQTHGSAPWGITPPAQAGTALRIGVRALSHLAVDYLTEPTRKERTVRWRNRGYMSFSAIVLRIVFAGQAPFDAVTTEETAYAL